MSDYGSHSIHRLRRWPRCVAAADSAGDQSLQCEIEAVLVSGKGADKMSTGQRNRPFGIGIRLSFIFLQEAQ